MPAESFRTVSVLPAGTALPLHHREGDRARRLLHRTPGRRSMARLCARQSHAGTAHKKRDSGRKFN